MVTIAFTRTEFHAWFERDRARVELRDALTGATLIEFWDDDVSQLMEDGFLDRKRLHRSLYDYGVHLGAFKECP